MVLLNRKRRSISEARSRRSGIILFSKYKPPEKTPQSIASNSLLICIPLSFRFPLLPLQGLPHRKRVSPLEQALLLQHLLRTGDRMIPLHFRHLDTGDLSQLVEVEDDLMV